MHLPAVPTSPRTTPTKIRFGYVVFVFNYSRRYWRLMDRFRYESELSFGLMGTSQVSRATQLFPILTSTFIRTVFRRFLISNLLYRLLSIFLITGFGFKRFFTDGNGSPRYLILTFLRRTVNFGRAKLKKIRYKELWVEVIQKKITNPSTITNFFGKELTD